MHITIEENVTLLKRYAYLEHACMRTLTGWLPGVPEWEAKNEFGLHIWESADAADQLRGRLRELRAHQPERSLSTGLELVFKELDYAQNTAEVVATVYLVIKKALLDAYRNHPDLTWADFDNPTVKVTENLISNTAKQVAWAEQYFPTIAAHYPGWETWRDYIAGLLAADGGVTGTAAPAQAPARPDHHPLLPWKECQRMPDWPIFSPAEDVEPNRKADPEGHRLWRFKHYLNEMTAAETLGSILWMAPEMEWEYQHNVSRHLWDEIRHSQLGQIRIQQLGLNIAEAPQVGQIYNVMMTLPAIDQYALLTTVIEPNGMPEKRANREHWEEIEDDTPNVNSISVNHELG